MATNTIDLGITQEELREEVISRATDRLVMALTDDEYVKGSMRSVVMETAAEVAQKIADEEVRPWAENQIDALIMQRTNEWGEKRGEPVTFREYLIKLAEDFMAEPVNREGKSRKEDRFGYSFTAVGPRLAFMVDSKIHHSISSAITHALKDANSKVAASIAEVVKTKLREVSEAVKVEVKTR